MPWLKYPDPDDTIGDWLKSLYPAYRLSLVDPSVLPEVDDMDWDFFWAGAHTTSFIVYEESTVHRNLGLGTSPIEFIATNVIRVTHRWINQGKSPIIKEMREFVTRKIHENIYPLPAAFTSAGIVQVDLPGITSRTSQATNSAQEDFWTFELRLATKVLNTIV